MKSSIPGAFRICQSRVFFLRGCEPSRYVVDYLPEQLPGYRFLSSMECLPEDRKPWATQTRPFDDLADAISDFGQRTLEDVARVLEEHREAVGA